MPLDNMVLILFAEASVNEIFKEAFGKHFSVRDPLTDPKTKSDWDFMFSYTLKALTHTDNLEYYIPNTKPSRYIKENFTGQPVRISKSHRNKFLNLLAYYQGLNLL